MGARQSRGVVLGNQISNTQTAQGNPHVIVCQETQRTLTLCCTVINYCPKAPNFDTSAVKNHQGLTNFLDDGRRSGGAEVERKFSEAHEKLQRGHVNMYLWTVPFIMVGIFGIVAACILHGKHQVQCRTTKICNPPNFTVGGMGECPTVSDWAVDCCYVFCNTWIQNDENALYQISYGGKEDCQPDINFNKYIEANQAFGLDCYCTYEEIIIPSYSSDSHRIRTSLICGEAKVYGDFKHLPGFFASPHVTTLVFQTCCLLIPLIILTASFYAWYRTSRIDGILQNHFQDWRERGINVQYHRPRRLKEPGRIVLILPTGHVSLPPHQRYTTINIYENYNPYSPPAVEPSLLENDSHYTQQFQY